ncbi:MAG: hypothetical protein V4682_01895 [Patescibacteria group bacterium]
MNKKLLLLILVLVGLVVWAVYDIYTGTISEDYGYDIPTVP